jgi:hypothetical protein
VTLRAYLRPATVTVAVEVTTADAGRPHAHDGRARLQLGLREIHHLYLPRTYAYDASHPHFLPPSPPAGELSCSTRPSEERG